MDKSHFRCAGRLKFRIYFINQNKHTNLKLKKKWFRTRLDVTKWNGAQIQTNWDIWHQWHRRHMRTNKNTPNLHNHGQIVCDAKKGKNTTQPFPHTSIHIVYTEKPRSRNCSNTQHTHIWKECALLRECDPHQLHLYSSIERHTPQLGPQQKYIEATSNIIATNSKSIVSNYKKKLNAIHSIQV